MDFGVASVLAERWGVSSFILGSWGAGEYSRCHFCSSPSEQPPPAKRGIVPRSQSLCHDVIACVLLEGQKFCPVTPGAPQSPSKALSCFYP